MDVASLLYTARTGAGLSQARLAAKAGTSQATISAYESGRKEPTVATLDRLLRATGVRLALEPLPPPVVVPTAAELAGAGRRLLDVLALAEALPVRHDADLRYPRLDRPQPLLRAA